MRNEAQRWEQGERPNPLFYVFARHGPEISPFTAGNMYTCCPACCNSASSRSTHKWQYPRLLENFGCLAGRLADWLLQHTQFFIFSPFFLRRFRHSNNILPWASSLPGRSPPLLPIAAHSSRGACGGAQDYYRLRCVGNEALYSYYSFPLCLVVPWFVGKMKKFPAKKRNFLDVQKLILEKFPITKEGGFWLVVETLIQSSSCLFVFVLQLNALGSLASFCGVKRTQYHRGAI